MSAIRTTAAAEMLGVSPSTLREWERRLGYPRPRRTQGNHRHYDIAELEALRDALGETGEAAAAVEVARRRGTAPSSPSRLLSAFERFDEAAADRAMEQSLALRSLERATEDLLLPAIEAAAERGDRAAELQFALRWATGWLHSARRLAPPANRPEGVLLLDAGPPLTIEALYTQALELSLRRSGLRVLLLPAELEEGQFESAIGALEPAAVVICGAGASLDTVGEPLRRLLRGHAAPRVRAFRGAQLVSGREGIRQLGATPGEATEALLAELREDGVT